LRSIAGLFSSIPELLSTYGEVHLFVFFVVKLAKPLRRPQISRSAAVAFFVRQRGESSPVLRLRKGTEDSIVGLFEMFPHHAA
jgi:hypothetical protein